MLMADGFRTSAFADLGIKPAARVHSLRFACQRKAPFPEVIFKELFVERSEIAHLANPHSVQTSFRHFPDARDLSYVQRGKEVRSPAPGEIHRTPFGLA